MLCKKLGGYCVAIHLSNMRVAGADKGSMPRLIAWGGATCSRFYLVALALAAVVPILTGRRKSS
jgi:hypothetical protein